MSLIDKILAKFGLVPDASAPVVRRVYKIGGEWGDRIEWWSSKRHNRRVVGWKQRIPCVDDVLLAPMESDKTGRFKFVKVDRQRDPWDMFFADVEFLGYENEDSP